MLRQIEVHGQRFEICSIDGGRTWSTDPRSLIAFKRRQAQARADVKKRFAAMVEDIPSIDPNDVYQLALPGDSNAAY